MTSAISDDPTRMSLKASVIRIVRDLLTVTFKRRSDAPPSMALGGGGRLWARAAGTLSPPTSAIKPHATRFCNTAFTMLAHLANVKVNSPRHDVSFGIYKLYM